MRIRRLACLLAGLALLGACGSSADSSSAPAPTEAATTDAPVDTTPVDPGPVETSAPGTVPADTTASSGQPRLLTKSTSRVLEGHSYVTDESAVGTPIEFTMPENGYATVAPGFFTVNRQGSGEETLVTISDLSQAQIFEEPTADLATYGGDNATILANTVPAPDDFLAWFASLPGVAAGEVTDGEVLGRPAKSMPYTVGDFPGSPCLPNGLPCLLATFFAAGFTNVYNPGNSGTLSVIDVGGRPVLVDVTSDDGSADLASAISLG